MFHTSYDCGIIARKIALISHNTSTQSLQAQLDIYSSLNSDGGRSAALVALGSHDLVVVSTQVHAQLSPSIEVVGSGNSSSDSLVLANGPVLGEGSGSLDGSGVGAGSCVDIVDGSIGGDGALVRASTAGVVVAVGLDDVVLDQGVSGPAIDGEIAVAARGEGAAVGNVPGVM